MSQEDVERARERYQALSRAVQSGGFDGWVKAGLPLVPAAGPVPQ